MFYVTPNTTTNNFSLYASTPFNYEEYQSFTITIRVTDMNSSFATGYYHTDVDVTINVLNVNEAPQFTNVPSLIYILENATVNSEIATITATDVDFNTSLVYTILNGSATLYFSINQTTGVINLIQKLDRETTDEYTAFVMVSDGSLSAFQEIKIIVVDVNDNNPIFSPVDYNVTIIETTLADTSILQLSATDLDSDQNTLLSYTIFDGNNNGFFDITSNGMLFVAKKLDHQIQAYFRLSITVSDNGGRVSNRSAIVSISLIDANNFSPVFSLSMYTATVREDSQLGLVILRVNASDIDSTHSIRYSLLKSFSSQYFAVDSISGNISIVKSLDYENSTFHEFTVVANDSASYPRIGMASVKIHVTDTNDNLPFLQGPFHHTIQEKFETGLVAIKVSATDADTGNNARITYAISAAYPSNPFSISATSGEVLVTGNFESSVKQYNITVTATNAGPTPLSSAANYTLNLADSNDNKQVFSHTQYSFSVSENQAGAFVGCVGASDADQTIRNKMINYTIISISDHTPLIAFSINSSGCIHTTMNLNREQKSSYQLTVQASDNGILRLGGFASVYVTVIDKNDHPPVFSKLMYNLTLTEETLVQTTVLRLEATDQDSGRNKALTFSILEGNINNTFKISNTGVMTLQKKLDKETLASYDLKVFAFDKGNPVMNSSVLVFVTVIDSNDHSPVFEQSIYTANVSELTQIGKIILNVSATDADSHVITYSIDSSQTMALSVFQVNSATGQISLKSNLNFEVTTDYWFTGTATDNGLSNRKSTTLIHVAVINENEFSPQFSQTFAAADVVQSSSVGTIIKVVSATDADAGDFGFVTYHLSSSSDLFAINNITGVIYLRRSIISSDPRNINLNITATDNGVPPMHSSNYLTIHITVIHQNDNPIFENITYSSTVPEDTTVGTTVLIVEANDVDKEANGQLSYSLLPTEIALPFIINCSTGAISLNKTLDRENLSSYKFFVRVQDGGRPTGIAVALVNIYISDVNDNSPSWVVSTYNINISEYFTVGAKLLTVLAQDPDLGKNGKLQYSVTEGNAERYFGLDSSTGVITLQKSLNSLNANGKSFNLNVNVQDTGNPTRNSTEMALVLINVINVDDNQPVFDKSYYEVTIPESTSASIFLLSVQATDKDGDTITYKLRNSTYKDRFIMQGNNITLAKSIDYESGSNIYLTVEALSGGINSLSGTAHVRIVVTDANDNIPIFSQTFYSVNVSERSSPGQLIAVVSASDADSSSNGQLSYHINSSGPFIVVTSHNKGLIYLASSLDYELNRNYTILVNASDNGSPKRFASQRVTVIVTVLDVNDNSPVFLKSSYNASLLQNTTVGSRVIEAAAVDNDGTDPNNCITYIIANIETIPFIINASTGVITLSNSLFYKTKKLYQIFVIARDRGIPAREGRTVISVSVIAQNLDNPVFLVRHYSVSIREGILVGSFVTQVQAADNDTADQTLVFSFLSGNSESKFRIDNHGKVYVNGTIDREMTSFYNLSVSLSDGGSPPRTAFEQAEVLIYILDINDNTPVFNASEYSKSVSEDTSGGTSILTVVASDNDYGNNSKIIYSFLDPTVTTIFFSVNSQSGEIRLADKLNYTDTQSITFYVIASDQGSSSRSSSMKVVITVLDVNEKPYFSPQTYSINVTEALPVGSSILSVTAKDKDSTANSVLNYNLISGDSTNRFEINTLTGLISLRNALDVDPNGQQLYTLTILATDSGSPHLSSNPSATVSIRVVNFNEHQPLFTKRLYELFVPENTSVGLIGTSVNATDKDGDQLTYSLLNSTDASYLKIDNITGELSLAKNLDFETIQKLTFMVRATDNILPTYSTDTQVVIYVSDINDNAPSFKTLNYTSYTTRSALVGSILVNLHATDQDSGINGKIQYQFVNAPSNLPFEIVGSTIRIKASLADTNITLYTFNVVAVDQGSPSRQSNNASISIYVPLISTVPRFMKPFYNITIKENTTVDIIIIQVRAYDPDIGPHGQITYMFGTTYDSHLFTINQTTGEIRLARNGLLNFRVKSQHVLIVKATDGSGNFDKAVIHIHVEDINDQYPIFQKTSYVVVIPESTAVSTTLLQVHAKDGDTGLRGQVNYEISSGNTDLMFNITSDGTITLAKAISPDGPSSYALVVVARDNGSPAKYSINNVTVVFHIQLCLDYTPKFNQTEYLTSVTENRAPEDILQVHANSPLIGGSIRYFIMDNKFNDTFAINASNGMIRTLRSLDREVIGSYTLIVGVKNTLSNSQSDHAIVVITVSDVNDNFPSFAIPSKTISISEATAVGTTVATVSALDDDDGQRAKVNYTIVSGNTNMAFSINDQGQIIILKSLDYETKSQYNLLINASDFGPPATIATESFSLQLNILNENDNSPKFNQTVYYAVFPETIPVNSLILTVLANDIDGDNLYYSILDPAMKSFFKVNATTGLVSVIAPLDYDLTSVHHFAVEVSDGGMPARKDFTMVEITLTDVNDNPPFLPTTLYSATISEEAAVGSTLLIVGASDRDSGNNGKLVFDIIGGEASNSPFVISDKGIITVNSSLDYESIKQFNLTISVHDLGSPPSYARNNITVTIQVKNENDNFPVFDECQYNATLAESSSAISNVIQVHASDEDRLTTLEYSILDPRLRSMLFINSSTGVICAPNGLDFEATKSLRFAVQVSDCGANPLKTLTFVVITLTDVNDNSPVFSEIQYNVSLQHSFPSDIAFLTVSAVDKDSGINAKITYSIVSTSPGLTTFVINSTNGSIYFTGNLTGNTTYTLVVKVTDRGGNYGTTKVMITVGAEIVSSAPVTVVNNYSPAFTKSVYLAKVPENIAINSLIVTVSAIDLDGDNLIYSIPDSFIRSVFRVNATNGTINTVTALDYEITTMYRFIVEASDGGTPVRKNFTTVRITLTDVNDNVPTLLKTFYSAEVSELAPVSSTVLIMSGTDLDSGNNGKLVFNIIEARPSSHPFFISEKRVISVESRLDYEQIKQFNLTVSVHDSGSPLLYARDNITITIQVKNENDNFPVFDESQYNATLAESSSAISNIIQVHASDIDRLTTLEYSILDPQLRSVLHIDTSTGLISAPNGLDFEATKSLRFAVQVSDGGEYPLKAFTFVVITLTDINDNSPVFFTSQYNASLQHRFPSKIAFLAVSATDKDSGINAEVTYSIDSITPSLTTFIIDSTNGGIYFIGNLTGNTIYTLVVKATDGGGNYGTTKVRITVDAKIASAPVTVNNYSPLFTKRVYSAKVPENIAINSLIVTVSAIDQNGNNLTYSLLDPVIWSVFRVNAANGAITTIAALDYETTAMYCFIVEVSDGGTPVRRNFTTVHITLTDVNDNAPTLLETFYSAAVSEMAPIGSTVLIVIGTDLDSGSNSKLVFDFIEARPSRQPFLISEKGVITLKSRLDHEKVKQYNLTVSVHDSGSPPLYAKDNITVTIQVKNENDNFPLFDKPQYNATLAESSSHILNVIQVHASDKDRLTTLEYSILGPRLRSILSIHPCTGVISAPNGLDFEETKSLQFYVQVSDGGLNPLKAFTLVVVTLTDVNDNSPVFSASQYNVELPKSFPSHTAFLTVTATDRDSGINAKITYSIVGITLSLTTFVIDSIKGSIYFTGSLKGNITYTLVVKATDGGGNHATAKVMVTPTSTIISNENSPAFTKSVYSRKVPENIAINSLIVTVSATDQDGDNLTYNIPDSFIRSVFRVNASNGAITIIASLDYETTAMYHFIVEVSDGGTPVRRNFTTVHITLTDVNDNAPTLLKTFYSVEVSEAAPFDCTAFILIGTDLDSGNNSKLVFNIIEARPSSHPFLISEKGEITLKSSLDYEQIKQYNLTVSVHDSGSPPLYARDNITVSIQVKNENDNFPVFDKSQYNSTLGESSSAIPSIIKVHASDADQLNSLEYSILDKRLLSVLQISSSTGLISAPEGLDFETINSYRFVVQVSDGGAYLLKSFTFVQITLTDINDNGPTFSANEYNVSLPHDFPSITAFFRTSASDRDSGDNSNITYSVDSVIPSLTSFKVNSANGDIYFVGNLTVNTAYTIVVRATDGGGKYGTTKVRVKVDARNSFLTLLPADINTTTITTLEVAIDIGKSILDFKQMTKFDILIQEYHPDDPDSKFIFIFLSLL